LIGLSALIGSLNVSAGGLFLLLGLLASPLILRSNYSMIDWVTDNAGRWFARFKTRSASHSLTIVPRSLYLPFLAYLAHWLVISLVLCLIFLPLLGDQVFSNSLLIVAAIPLGVLTGFLALWAPGGIGVREAVIIGVLALNMDIEVASSIAITYRLICVVNDSVMGLVAFVFYGRGLATT